MKEHPIRHQLPKVVKEAYEQFLSQANLQKGKDFKFVSRGDSITVRYADTVTVENINFTGFCLYMLQEQSKEVRAQRNAIAEMENLRKTLDTAVAEHERIVEQAKVLQSETIELQAQVERLQEERLADQKSQDSYLKLLHAIKAATANWAGKKKAAIEAAIESV